MKGKVLIVDDDESMCEMIEADLKTRGFDPAWNTSTEKALLQVKEEGFDVVLTDLKMPHMDGIEFCRQINAIKPEIPVVVMTAFGSMETAIAAIRAGAFDFITKPMEMDILAIALERAVNHRNLKEKVKRLEEVVAQTNVSNQIIGNSTPMKELFSRLKRIADTDITVLISGESGTGKELVARALHEQSARKDKPFISVNCAAIPENLLESELFGHAKGAFTNAHKSHTGMIVQAEGGTLFLDEIGDFPLSLQPKLLRALEEHVVRPVGAEKEIAFDVRLIAATNHELEQSVQDGTFRSDLFFRINVMNIKMPPLNSRGNDILLLAQHFVEQYAPRYKKEVTGISKAVAERLLSHTWSGNVRELRNVIERAVALTRYEKIMPEDLPDELRDLPLTHRKFESDDVSSLLPLKEMSDQYIQHVLDLVGGNKTKAARILGLDRKTLYRRMNEQTG